MKVRSSATPKSEKKEGVEVVHLPKQKFPCKPMETVLEQTSTLQYIEDPMAEQMYISSRNCNL